MSDDPTLPADVRVVRYDVRRAGARRRPRRRGARAVGQRPRAGWPTPPAASPACAGCRRSRPGPDAALAAGFARRRRHHLRARAARRAGRRAHPRPGARRGPAAAGPRPRAGRSTAGPASSAACRTPRPGQAFRTPRRRARADLGLRVDRRPARAAAQRAGRAGHGRRDRRRRPARLPGDLGVRPARPPAAHRRADLAAARHRRRPGTRSTPASWPCCPAHAWVVNVGRGATLDEAALLDALRSGPARRRRPRRVRDRTAARPTPRCGTSRAC